jgi:hypothetical protein
MRNKGGHGLKARIKINDIPQCDIDILNNSTFTVEIKDTATGKIESSVTRPMRSFTANFLRLMWGRMTGAACTGGLDINDTAIDESSGKATNLKCVGATSGLKKFGIAIGTGTGAVAQTDNKLTWDTGFTTYGATTLKTATVISGSDIYFEIQKAFTNNTGSTRTIEEIGLCTTGEGTEADNNTNVLIARELTGGDAVDNGKPATVVFKISSTFTTNGVITKNFMELLEESFRDNQGQYWKLKTAAAAFTARTGTKITVYKGKMWIIGGQYSGGVLGDVWNSTDGNTWTKVRDSADANGFVSRRAHTVLVFVDPADSKEKMWVIGGFTTADVNSVYCSEDGVTWTQKRADGAAGGFTKCRAHASFVYDGKMWVAGGVGVDDVYYSTNGVSWTAATTSAAFGNRYLAGAIVHDGKMWLIGGSTGTPDSKVYYSTDGATWTAATTSAAFGNREGVGAVSYAGKMIIWGGRAAPTYYTSVYSSTDGAAWTQATSDWGAGAKGFDAAGCVFSGRVFSTVPFDGTTYYSAVWSFMCSIFDLDTTITMGDSARIDAASGSVYGITAGTGTTDFTGADVALVTPIADGSGASQLDYGDMTDAGRLSEPTVSGADNIMRLERDFANNSGGAITIKEVGLSAKGLDALGLLLLRGKVDKAVADGASVRVAIELITTV